jgi:hypothetical protein
MKELSIEQKARAYDEAIERANSLLSSNELGNAWIYKLLPELEESEDEGIKEELKKVLDECLNVRPQIVEETQYIRLIDWLEKQGEQKSANWFQELEDKLANATPKQLAEWKEKYFKEEPAEWSEEDEAKLKSILFHIEDVENKDVIDWLKSIKDRVQPKQEWSEDDEEMFNEIILDLKALKNRDTGEAGKAAYQREIDWLESLRPQSQWKPSEEQLKSLKEVIDVGHFTSYPNALEILYEQLKKLRADLKKYN